MDFDWRGLVKTVAPAIAGVFGTPVAGLAVGALTRAIWPGDDPPHPTASEEEIAIALSGATPEMLARIKAEDHNFKLEMKKLNIDLEKLHGEDRASARVMATSTSLRPQMILGTVFVGGFAAVAWGIFSGEVVVAPEVQPIMNVVLGIMAGAVTQILNFFFGSSSGSKEKTAALVQK